MGVTLWFAAGSDASWLTDSAITRAVRLSGVIAVGASSYFAALRLLGFRLRDFSRQHVALVFSKAPHKTENKINEHFWT